MKKCCWLYAGERIATYSACMIGKSIPELIDDYNTVFDMIDKADVVYYRQAVLQALEEKGIDISAVDDPSDFSQQVEYDGEDRRLRLAKKG